MGGGAKIQSSQNPIHLMSTTGISNLEFSSQFHSCVNAINMDWNPNISLQHMASNFFFGKDIDLKAQFKDSWHHCKLKAVSECALQMSQVFYESSRFNVKPLAKMATNSGSCNVQILRSSASWSLGLNKPDCSIMNAWCDAITNSERLVYIENQFFIGSVMRNKADNPRNSVPAAILERVVKAAKLGEKFKCVIIIPQHPQGDIAFKQTPRIILHYQSETINRGINSIFSQFKQQCPGIDPSKYIGFYCLQNWGILNGQFVHNQVYVHDKMCVIDDRIMIVGSANINDRSMLGERDSEVAIRIEDTNLLTIGKSPDEYKVGSVPHEVRCR
jgi:phosphatidylserine/phosphatidylglycerophosphate/cardiolipin synthase-like enzyme